VTVPDASGGTAIDLSAAINGVRFCIAVANGPAHCTINISGSWLPTRRWPATEAITASFGSGGTSFHGTVSITVTARPLSLTFAAGSLPADTVGPAYSQTATASGRL
jgi:hypothetical protein